MPLSGSYSPDVTAPDVGTESASVAIAIQSACRLLPSNGSLRYFRHRNVLHGFDHLPFADAVIRASDVYQAQSFRPVDSYRRLSEELPAFGNCVSQVLHQHADADELVAGLISQTDLRAAILKSSPAFTDASADASGNTAGREHSANGLLTSFVGETNQTQIPKRCLRGRDVLLKLTGTDTDALVRDFYVPFVAAFLDQGQSSWQMPYRDDGLLSAFCSLYGQPDGTPARCSLQQQLLPPWLRSLPEEIQRLQTKQVSALASVCESLSTFRVAPDATTDYLAAILLTLPGWSGMLHHLEQAADWHLWTAPCGTLTEHLAVLLILDRLVVTFIAEQELGIRGSRRPVLEELNRRHADLSATPNTDADAVADEAESMQAKGGDGSSAEILRRVAETCRWNPEVLPGLTAEQRGELLTAIRSFSDNDQRCCLQEAAELSWRRMMLNSVAQVLQTRGSTVVSCSESGTELTPRIDARRAASSERNKSSRNRRREKPKAAPRAAFQVLCCSDPCHDSLRRNLEQPEFDCQTYAIPGFFGLAMNFRYLGEPTFAPHHPDNVRSRHFVQEVPGFRPNGQLRHHPRERRRRFPEFRGPELSSLLENWLSRPWMTRLLFPGLSHRMVRWSRTDNGEFTGDQLDIEGATLERLPGYTVEDMAAVVADVFRLTGIHAALSPLVLVLGHRSHSVNDPFAAAGNCAFCSGRSSGPNARVFARMANDPRVRKLLQAEGMSIPTGTVFVAAEHDTTADTIEYLDLNLLTPTQKDGLPRLIEVMDEVLCRRAYDRCRRYFDIPENLSPQAAAEFAEDRAEDLTELLPDPAFCGNSWCFIGRRSRTADVLTGTEGFQASYDPSDDEDGARLSLLMKMLLPTCMAVNLQYYFSATDADRYGAGSRLQHNLTSLLGVTDSATGDLRFGIPLQLSRLHEPRRLLCMVESQSETVAQILQQNAALKRYVDNQWMFLAVIAPDGTDMEIYDRGRFVPWVPDRTEVPATAFETES
ncbi:MAG: DUF2309 family protein [Planctomycetaceae bacterium]|nr:DUF2309 family protein [Planctomycetaceae bacterium]